MAEKTNQFFFTPTQKFKKIPETTPFGQAIGECFKQVKVSDHQAIALFTEGLKPKRKEANQFFVLGGGGVLINILSQWLLVVNQSRT